MTKPDLMRILGDSINIAGWFACAVVGYSLLLDAYDYVELRSSPSYAPMTLEDYEDVVSYDSYRWSFQ